MPVQRTGIFVFKNYESCHIAENIILNEMIKLNSKHWSDYWSQGITTSLPLDFKKYYEGEIASFWYTQYSKLKTRSKVLDVCTGNCSIPLLLSKFAEEEPKELTISAVDAALIKKEILVNRFPEYQEEIENIDLKSNVMIEKLPFECESFDMVTSQFGIEYCDTEKALSEVSRVLKAGGQFALIKHDANSEIFTTSRADLNDYFIIDKLRTLIAIKEYFNEDRSFLKLRQLIKRSLNQVHASGESKRSAILSQFLLMLSDILSNNQAELNSLKDKIFSFIRDYEQGKKRLNDLFFVFEKLNKGEVDKQIIDSVGLKLLTSSEILNREKKLIGISEVYKKNETFDK